MRRLTITFVAVIGLMLAACVPGEDAQAAPTTSSPTTDSTSSFQDGVHLETASLQPAGSCEELLTAYQERALELVGPYGIGGGDFWVADMAGTEETAAAAEGGADDAGRASGYQTNVQVEGVDEADMIKSDGRFIYDIMNGTTVRVWERTDQGLEARGRFRLDRESNSNQLLLNGDTLVIVASRWEAPTDNIGREDAAYPGLGSQFAELIELDVSDPNAPEETGRLVMDGYIVSSRLVDDQLRVVLQSGPVGIEWAFPEGGGLRSERSATEQNREIISETTIDNWLPYAIATGPDSDEEGVMFDCEDVLVPGDNNGVDTLSIVEFEVGDGLAAWTGGGVLANGETVYATPDRVYVATGPWQDPIVLEQGDGETRDTSSIHRFDTPADGDPVYVASGEVPGYLLNQFAMDEYNGDLRVASTETPAWWGEGRDSESYVTVLRTEGDELTEIGSIDDLGVTEQIYAVRFMGDMGYVITFRQVDPLYTIDLSNPTSPEMRGELKIPGYSAYLHPLENDHLLGIGQDATDEGRTTGLQASLFDVSDPADPSRLDTTGVRDAYSPIEYDHHAFTTNGETAFVPYETWSWNEDDETESMAFGVLAIPLSGDDLSDARELIVAEGKADGGGDLWRFSPQRTLVFDDTLYAFGHGGITEIDLTTGEITDRVSR